MRIFIFGVLFSMSGAIGAQLPWRSVVIGWGSSVSEPAAIVEAEQHLSEKIENLDSKCTSAGGIFQFHAQETICETPGSSYLFECRQEAECTCEKGDDI